MKRILVTGASGFIGSRYILNHLSRMPHVELMVGVDWSSEFPTQPPPKYVHRTLDLTSTEGLLDIIQAYRIDTVFHLAALTSVDSSIRMPELYGVNNCLSALSVMEAARQTHVRLVNASTDEVYGPMQEGERVDESGAYRPTNPYSASKAYGVMLAHAYSNTYALNVSTTLACNTYGPRQTFNKLIPRAVRLLSEGKPVPIYGNGKHSRNWMHVDDHCRALTTVATYGNAGLTYNVEDSTRLTTIQVVNMLANIMGIDPAKQPIMEFGTENRLGHDVGYGMHTSSIRALGWAPQESIFSGLRSTVEWYLKHQDLWKDLE